MLRFFRQIRKTLLENGNLRKYFWYAFGEIFLVVIGILIALQINNWNQNQNQDKQTRVYLSALINEIDENTERLESIKPIADAQIKNSVEGLKVLNSDSAENLSDNELWNTLGSFANPTYVRTLKRAVFDDIINSGVLEHIEDQDLKDDIFSIGLYIDSYNEIKSETNEIWFNYLMPYAITHFPLSNLVNGILSDSTALSNLDIDGMKNNDQQIPETIPDSFRAAVIKNGELSNIVSANITYLAGFSRSARITKEAFVDLRNRIASTINDYD